MNKRLELHDILCELLGSTHVYYQPPENVKILYPAIIYRLDGIKPQEADDIKYHIDRRYTVTIIDKDPESFIFERFIDPNINKLRYCTFDRTYCSSNLNHFVFTIYF